jgi:phosphonate transport system substrate-binding protein
VVDAVCAIPPAAHICTLPAFQYVFAHDYCRVETGLTGLQFGAPTYSGQIITRIDAGITSLSDLRGKTFCRPHAYSTTGWILPDLTMRAAGLNPLTDLARIADADSHVTVVNAVYSGWCDAGATFVDARTLFAQDHPDVMEQVFVVATTPSIPNDGIHFGPGLPRELHSTVADAFVSIAHTSEGQDALSDAFGWDGLLRQDDTVYDPLRAVLRASGTDIRELID